MLRTTTPIEETMRRALDKRKDESLLRTLQCADGLVDFCSNDYLSFSRSNEIKEKVKEYEKTTESFFSGSTGSRSISGNTTFAEALEEQLASFHGFEAALLFNSGYDANLGLFSSIARKDDTIICDELIHASIIDGCRLGYANRLRFAHNDIHDLEKKLGVAKGNIFVAVESVYSMDGDQSPLLRIAEICEEYGANLIVDEAHATGVFGDHGRGLVSHYNLEDKVFACVYTFGKAIGCHGAVVTGSNSLREYLINFARSFIFTTASPMHSLVTIKSAYELLDSGKTDNSYLHELIQTFRKGFTAVGDVYLIDSTSAIQSIVIPGNERARAVSKALQQSGFDVRAILSPSVPAGKERLRVSLHMHNTMSELYQLLDALQKILAR